MQQQVLLHQNLHQQNMHHQRQYQQHLQLQQLQLQQNQNVANAFQSLFSTTGEGVVGEQQRKPMKVPTPVRSETTIMVDDKLSCPSLSSSSSVIVGDISISLNGSTNIADAPPSPHVERELQESFQEDASFDEDDDLRKDNDVDENDLDFLDIEEETVIPIVPPLNDNNNDKADISPMTPKSGSPSTIVTNEKGVDVLMDVNNNDNNNQKIIIDDMIKLARVKTTTTPSMLSISSCSSPNIDIINGNCINLGSYNSNHHPSSKSSSSSLYATTATVAVEKKTAATGTTMTATKVITTNNNKKKTREIKFRAYQAENWTEKFEELLRFRE